MAVRDEAQGSWVGLNKLVEIRLSGCKECEEIPALGHLPNLKHLRLQGFQNVKSINSSFYGIDSVGICQDTIIVFPVLERLELNGMTTHLREWTKIEFPETRQHEVKVFPRLKYLTISACKRLMSAPSHFSTCLQTLGISWMGNGTPLANICEVTLMSLTDLHIVGVDGLECLPDWSFHNNQNISKLNITNCYELRELPNGLHNLNYLEEFTILDCWNLKSIGNPSGSKGQSQASFRRLQVKNCVGLMDLPHEMVESWAPSLETVTLDNLCSLKNLPMVIEYITKSTRLTKLTIVGVPKFMATRGVESWHLRSLRELEIDVSVEWSRESSVAIKETVDAMLRGCSHSLVKLDLRGLEI